MSHDSPEHKITACHRCNADAHEKAEKEREEQQRREEDALSARLFVAKVAVGLVVLIIWALLMAVLSRIG
ncbi:putative membrane protein CrgA [Streptomyces sp. NBRC 110611]|uniref:hypothetical protein n=1 Tax=Streptomyces sp. NBRC 110611 TaxID=1621259 RepID=UPI000831EB73|nr:hypothetical protein [Streptomyces sp. NBRC 110611]GAU67705.1 putative membrane protein CrgA [Streptomyces sp. NBRC 110611]